MSETDDSKNAAAVNFVYDKARRAELRRNNWRFSIRRTALRPFDANTVIVQPALYSSTIAYQPGAIVADSSGLNWISTKAFNLGVTPGTDSSWDIYFGPMSAEPYSATTNGYFTGEFVYENVGSGATNIFSALTTTTSTTSTDPSVATPWSATVIFSRGEVVQYTDGYYYMSLVDLNLNNVPGTYQEFNANTTYAQNALIAGADGVVYISLVNSNLGHNPITDAGVHWAKTINKNAWTNAFAGSTCGNQWQGQYATIRSPNIIYPLGSGPSSDAQTRNVFRLPNGFLRRAPQNPKAGIVAWMGAPVGNTPDDYQLEGDYLTSQSAYPILLRFAADITVVTKMDGMFCEGLAARIAMEICEEVTQSAEKIKTIAAAYKWAMGEARTVNGIETGTVEPDEDEFISVRR